MFKFAFVLTVFAASCSHAPAPVSAPAQKSVALIGGSHLDESAWSDVAKLMNEHGIKTTALPRLGRDADHPAHLRQIAELSCAALSQPSVVVAHSYAGAFANTMVGVCPDKITKIVYVAALVPMDGEHPGEYVKTANQKRYLSVVSIGKDRLSPKSTAKFYGAMDAGVATDRPDLPKLYSESMMVGGDTVAFKKDALDSIPKFYVYTTQDLILTPESQKKFTDRLQLAGSESLATGHLPMLSNAKELARVIEGFVSR